MRLGRRLVLLTAVTTLVSSPVAIMAAPGAFASTAAARAVTAGGPVAAAAGAMPAMADQGMVRCADLSLGTPQDVYLYPFGNPQHPIMLMHQGYGSFTEYMPVGAGQYTVAMRPVGTPASSPPSVSTSFMVSAGGNYTVASLGPASARRLEVLTDQVSGPSGSAMVRVVQASLKEPQVTVSIGSDVLARQLAFGAASVYQAVPPGASAVTLSTSGGHSTAPVTLAAGSVHTIVVLDGTSGLKIDTVTDTAASMDMNTPKGGAATGLGGTAPAAPAVEPWLVTLAGGLLLVCAGVFGLRRSRRTAAAHD